MKIAKYVVDNLRLFHFFATQKDNFSTVKEGVHDKTKRKKMDAVAKQRT